MHVEHQFLERLAKINSTSVFGPKDVESVVHYTTQKFLGMKTKSGASIPHNLFLSQKDIDGARKLYGTPTLTLMTSAYSMQEDVPKSFVISADTPDNLVPTSSSASCATLFLTSTTAPEILSQDDFTMEGLFPNCAL